MAMGKPIKPREIINDKTHITECTDGFWLYDGHRGMNLAMRADSEKAALLKALEYYQKRLIEVETTNKHLNEQINAVLKILEITEDPKL